MNKLKLMYAQCFLVMFDSLSSVSLQGWQSFRRLYSTPDSKQTNCTHLEIIRTSGTSGIKHGMYITLRPVESHSGARGNILAVPSGEKI